MDAMVDLQRLSFSPVKDQFNKFFSLLATALQKARSILLGDEEDSKKSSDKNGSKSSGDEGKASGMILPFEPMTMTFHGVNYYVDMPQVWGIYSFSFQNAFFFKDKNK